jgi:hypothetical protein
MSNSTSGTPEQSAQASTDSDLADAEAPLTPPAPDPTGTAPASNGTVHARGAVGLNGAGEPEGAPQRKGHAGESRPGEASAADLAEALGRVARQVEDARHRLEMAQSAAAGDEPELDELDRLTGGLGSNEEARRRRAEKLAGSAAEDLRETLRQLQDALQASSPQASKHN